MILVEKSPSNLIRRNKSQKRKEIGKKNDIQTTKTRLLFHDAFANLNLNNFKFNLNNLQWFNVYLPFKLEITQIKCS